jgi:phage terminase small subunit
MAQNTELTRKQETFLLAYLTQPTLIKACEVAGITDDTGRRWLRLPHVKEALTNLRKEVLDTALDGLVRNIDKAVLTLARHLDAEETPAGSQIRAAQIMLEQSIEHAKASELEQKIADLSRRLDKLTNGES